jgi:hypothetical protein
MLDLDSDSVTENCLLVKIRKLPDELIKKVYDYMTGKAKFICNKKYNLLEQIIKGDCNKGYTFYIYLKTLVESMTKLQLLSFIKKGSIQFHPFIIDKIWYLSKKTGKFYDKHNLINIWENEDKEEYKLREDIYKEDILSIDFNIKCRLIDAIYFYFLRMINRYEKNMGILIELDLNNYILNYNLNYNYILKKLDSIFYLYKSFELIRAKMNIIIENEN